jgi:hypothetical protein
MYKGVIMQTQKSSKPRIKNDTVGDDGLKLLFSEFEKQTLVGFKVLCTSMIEQSSGKRDTKEKFIREIEKATSKQVMLTKVTNYFLAGQGLGV